MVEKLVPCDTLVGLPRVPLDFGITPDIEDLRSEMNRLNFERCVIRHRFCTEGNPTLGNELLMEAVGEDKRFIPCWFLTPDGRYPNFDPAQAVEQMLERNVFLAWTDAQIGGFSLRPWCAGAMLNAMEKHRVPLLLDFTHIDPDTLDSLLHEHRKLPVILFNIARMGRHRVLYPLLHRHPNLYLTFSSRFSFHEGYENLCDTFGVHRWVFGTEYPSAEGGASITGLTYSRLSDEALSAIGYGNLERLLEEVSI